MGVHLKVPCLPLQCRLAGRPGGARTHVALAIRNTGHWIDTLRRSQKCPSQRSGLIKNSVAENPQCLQTQFVWYLSISCKSQAPSRHRISVLLSVLLSSSLRSSPETQHPSTILTHINLCYSDWKIFIPASAFTCLNYPVRKKNVSETIPHPLHSLNMAFKVAVQHLKEHGKELGFSLKGSRFWKKYFFLKGRKEKKNPTIMTFKVLL